MVAGGERNHHVEGLLGKRCKIMYNYIFIYEDNSISKLQIQVATYVFELSAGNGHR